LRKPEPSRELPRGTVLGFCLLLALAYPLYFHHLAERDLWSSHEARAAQDAQTILDDGAWGLPRLFDGRLEMQKPPLYYWLVASIARCRGDQVDAWAVRLPAALAGMGCMLTIYLFGVLRGRSLAGFLAATILATSLHFTWLARVGRIDMPLTFTVTLALGSFYLARSGYCPKTSLLTGYLAIAAGVMLKGPIGAALPLAVAGCFLLVERELPLPWQVDRVLALSGRWRLWWGVPLVLLLVLPWFLWASAETGGELPRVLLWHHNIERGFGGSDVLRAHPWWFYIPHLAADFLPWSLLLPLAGWLAWRRGWWGEDAEARFGLVWLAGVLIVLSCARFKRADYLLPAFSGAALFLGAIGERYFLRALQPRRLALVFGLTVTSCVVGWIIHVDKTLPALEPTREHRRFAEVIRGHAPLPEKVVFFRAEMHALAFHVGRPLDLLVQWHDLENCLAGRGETYIVMPSATTCEWPAELKNVRLEEVMRNTDLCGGEHEKPLVLLRTLKPAGR
jgi:4-amino-4-deoxy-L-arabinose transferase-like glycosyltransferase